jgi:hypothetical protein
MGENGAVRRLLFELLTSRYLDDQIKEDGMDREREHT